MEPPRQLLIDVRTPVEYATGHLDLGSTPALNIEYQFIDQLPSLTSAHGTPVRKTDSITLYCRSGRRSSIALQVLRGLGYGNVRDIGGLEEARAVLKREALLRAVREDEGVGGGGDGGVGIEGGVEREARVKSLDALLDGLRGLE